MKYLMTYECDRECRITARVRAGVVLANATLSIVLGLRQN